MTKILINAGAERRSQRAQSTGNNNRAQNKVQRQKKTSVILLILIHIIVFIMTYTVCLKNISKVEGFSYVICIKAHQQVQQQRTGSKQGCPGGGSVAECTLEACGSLRSLSARAFEACRKECQDRCKAGATGQNQQSKSNNQSRSKPQQRKQGSGRSQSQVNRIPLYDD